MSDMDTLFLLLVEDNPGDAFLIQDMAQECSDHHLCFDITLASDLSGAIEMLTKTPQFEAVVLDLGLPDSQGLATLSSVQQHSKDLPIVVLTGHDDEFSAINALKAGAQDYLVKGQVNELSFRRTILHSIERKRIEDALKKRNRELETLYTLSTSISLSEESDIIFSELMDQLLALHLFESDVKAAIYMAGNNGHVRPPDTTKNESPRLDSSEVIHINHLSLVLAKGYAEKEKHALLESVPVCSLLKTSDRYEIPKKERETYFPDHLVIPFIARKKLMGVLCIYHKDEPGMDAQTIKMLHSLGNQIGMAIANTRLYKETKHLSLHDALTGLANRRLMDIILSKNIKAAQRSDRPFCIAMADIDHFKRYNDTHGHPAGDKLLRAVAQIMLSEIRENDLAVRYGGEEFLISLVDTVTEQAVTMAERIRKSIKTALGITISIGIAEYDSEMGSTHYTKTIEVADKALYKAKSDGRDRVVTADKMEFGR